MPGFIVFVGGRSAASVGPGGDGSTKLEPRWFLSMTLGSPLVLKLEGSPNSLLARSSVSKVSGSWIHA
jgi:hypothetical protein